MNTYESLLPSSCTYLPNFPPSKNIKPSYSRFLLSAPVTALANVTPHAKKPSHFPLTTHCRMRVQVGVTNRWRLPAALGSDLLGTSQAIKAASSSINNASREIADTSDRLCSYSYSEPHRESSSHFTRGNRNGLRSAPARLKNVRSHQEEQASRTTDSSSKTKMSKDTTGVKEDPFSPRFLNQMHQHSPYISPEKRRPTPLESFFHISQTTVPYEDTDVILTALKFNWNLHRNFAARSRLLSALMEEAKYQPQNDFSFDENQGLSTPSPRQGVSVSISKSPLYTSRRRNAVRIVLDVEGNLITKNIFATALCALYDDEFYFERSDVTGVLAAADLLQMESLKSRCVNVMIEDIDANNVCLFHAASMKYKLLKVKEFCEQWLELNAVPMLSSTIYLCQLTTELLAKILKSHQLFTYDEYSLYKLLCNWVFLQHHPSLQIMPSWGTVVTWFMSIPKSIPFLEQDEGKQYCGFFKSLRLNGITNPGQLDEISKMGVLPSDWLLKVFSQHYYSLQGGGDMSLMTRFETGAIRYGFVLEQSTTGYSEVLSLHGFHFDIKANIDDGGLCTIYMQRLKPSDPLLSQRISERQTFSVRQDREVRYAIKVQYYDGVSFFGEGIGPKSQCFGLNNKSERSEELNIFSPILPLYVTFSLLFPPS